MLFFERIFYKNYSLSNVFKKFTFLPTVFVTWICDSGMMQIPAFRIRIDLDPRIRIDLDPQIRIDLDPRIRIGINRISI